jgi:hypothetical protein
MLLNFGESPKQKRHKRSNSHHSEDRFNDIVPTYIVTKKKKRKKRITINIGGIFIKKLLIQIDTRYEVIKYVAKGFG